MFYTKSDFLWVFLVSGLCWQQVTPTYANPVPANDGVGTSVIIDGNRFDITGGQLSGDQSNLFHSFQQFGLTREQIANFLSNPGIQNILVRVSGGDTSFIDGVLQVSGGVSNLLFINPSGVIFGSNAILNLPANFIATTADRLQFGDNWFSTFGDNNYLDLSGNPTGFGFSAEQPGAILNFADLSVRPGSQLGLLGGTVVSSGHLSSPAGEIVIATVPGKRAVRISQPGSLLQLEIELPPDVIDTANWSLPVTRLPELLTTTPDQADSSLQVTPVGSLLVADSNFDFTVGDVLIRSAAAGAIGINAVGDLTVIGGIFRTSRDLELAANQNLQLRDTIAIPLILESGRDLTLRGSQFVDILALANPETNLASGRDLQLVSNQAISGDTHFSSDRHFSILDLSNNPGGFLSLYDPIISANGNVLFGNYSGVSLKVEATGSITGGDISITGPDVGLTGIDPDIPILVNDRAAILRAGVDSLEYPASVPQNAGGTMFSDSGETSQLGNISVGNVRTSSFFSSDDSASSTIILSADGDISTGNLDADRSVSDGGSISVLTSNGSFSSGDIDASSTLNNGGSISISTFGNISTGELDTTGNGIGGPITVSSSNGSIQIASIDTGTFSSASSSSVNNGESVVLPGDGGSVQINALGNVNINGDIRTSTDDGSGGSVAISSASENVAINGRITSSTSETGNGGNITIFASNNISVSGNISASSFASSSSSGGSGGNVSISSSSTSGSIAVEDIFASGRRNVGQVNLSASQVSSGFVSNSTFSFTSGNSLLSTPTDEQTPSVASFTQPPSPLRIRETDDLENDFTNEFEQYFGRQFPRRFVTAENIRSALSTLDARTRSNRLGGNTSSGGETAVVYVSSEGSQAFLRVETPQNKTLEFVVGNPQRRFGRNPNTEGDAEIEGSEEAENEENIENVGQSPDSEKSSLQEITRDELEEIVRSLHREIQRPGSDDYLEYATQLYDWLIRPIEEQNPDIDMLLFSMESGLRLIPLAALYDNQAGQFLGEKYSISIIPNFGSIDVRSNGSRARVTNSSILAMGASNFSESDVFPPLNAVPIELSIIEDIWYTEERNSLPRHFSKNQDFTLSALREARLENPFNIVHLATHATFRPGDPSNSSIQLWDTALPLSQLQVETLNWNNPPIDLLVLSACQTALGDTQAELGFAGLSLQAEVRSTLASLWYVSDLGSLIYMMEFYRNLSNPNLITKAEVVQQTQISLLDRQRNFQNLQILDRKIEEMLELDRINLDGRLTPQERQGLQSLQSNIRNSGYELSERLTHPFYWSSFTLVGSPW